MENTSPFLFDNKTEKYFLALRGKAVGPLTAQEVYERVQKGEAGLLHYFWKDGWADWKRICDEKEFAVLIPQKPTPASIDHIKAKLAKKKNPPATSVNEDDAKNYYLYYSNSQYGPFSKPELVHVIQGKKLTAAAYLWMPGWPTWKRITEVEEFAKLAEALSPPSAPEPQPGPSGAEPTVKILKKPRNPRKKKAKTADSDVGASLMTLHGQDASERRTAPRRPLVARLFLHNDQEVIIAVCRDISVGGMQVLTDRVPGGVGTTVKLNVSPGDPDKVKGFVAEGEIVRVLEDGRGFSFRFKKITDEARKAIERYIRVDF